MPYITQEERLAIVQGKSPETPGQLNYLLSMALWKWCNDRSYVTDLEGIMLRYLLAGPVNYTRMNEIMGVLEFVYIEFRRRPQTKPYIFHAAKRIRELQDLLCAKYYNEYENKKLKLNGEVFL